MHNEISFAQYDNLTFPMHIRSSVDASKTETHDDKDYSNLVSMSIFVCVCLCAKCSFHNPFIIPLVKPVLRAQYSFLYVSLYTYILSAINYCVFVVCMCSLLMLGQKI